MFHLLLPPRLWLHEFAHWVREGGRIRVPLACCQVGGLRELIAQPGPIEPTGAGWQAPHFAQTLVVRFDSQVTMGSGQQLLREHRPTGNQLIAALVLGVGAAAGLWAAAVSFGGDLRPLDALRLIGPGMVTLEPIRAADPSPAHSSPPGSAVPSTPLGASNDWSRTRGALGADLFERVRQSRVALIGASRNGSFAAHAFAMLGVRSMILVDPDRDERHHLSATLGASLDGIGDWKVANRATSLLRIRPDLQVETWNRRFPDSATLEAIADVDLICTCTDHDLPRLAAARWANAHCRPHLDIGSGVFDDSQSTESLASSDKPDTAASSSSRRKGLEVQLTLPGEACLSCLAGLRREASAQDLLDGPPGLLPNEPTLDWDEQRAGSLPTINAIAANLGVQMWLELLAGELRASRWTRIEWEGISGPRLTHHAPGPGPCQVCRPPPSSRRTA